MRFDGLWTLPLLASSSTHPASLSVCVPTVAGLPAASFSLALAGSALQSSYRYHHRSGRVHFISIVQAHAGHTSADILVRRTLDHLDPTGLRIRMRTRMTALRGRREMRP